MFSLGSPWSCCLAILMLGEWSLIPGHWRWQTHDHRSGTLQQSDDQWVEAMARRSAWEGGFGWLRARSQPITAGLARGESEAHAGRRQYSDTRAYTVSLSNLGAISTSRCLRCRCPAGGFPTRPALGF